MKTTQSEKEQSTTTWINSETKLKIKQVIEYNTHCMFPFNQCNPNKLNKNK